MTKKYIKKESACPVKLQRSGGYTLIETMIAISLFIIIIMAGMGALLNANLLHQKSQSMRSIMDSMSFSMEDISRNLRTGYNYHCINGADLELSTITTPIADGSCWGIAFEYQDGSSTTSNDQWVYFVGKYLSDPISGIYKSTNGGASFVKLTPDEVVIDSTLSSFSIVGAQPPPGDTKQPFVTIKLVGKISFKNIETPFSLQTSVSQRVIDVGN